jgi:serine/threonine protein kinase
MAQRSGIADIGPYHIVARLGEGGMGTVYRAEQIEPIRRSVAIKVVRAELASDQVIARFEAERQALARMDHPNIAKVLDAGTDRGRLCSAAGQHCRLHIPLSSNCWIVSADITYALDNLPRQRRAFARPVLCWPAPTARPVRPIQNRT